MVGAYLTCVGGKIEKKEGKMEANRRVSIDRKKHDVGGSVAETEGT